MLFGIIGENLKLKNISEYFFCNLGWNTRKLLYRDYPARESSDIIDEFLFDNENDKVNDTIYFNTR